MDKFLCVAIELLLDGRDGRLVTIGGGGWDFSMSEKGGGAFAFAAAAGNQ